MGLDSTHPWELIARRWYVFFLNFKITFLASSESDHNGLSSSINPAVWIVCLKAWYGRRKETECTRWCKEYAAPQVGLGYHLLMLAAFSQSFRIFLHNVWIIYCGTLVLIHGANPASSSVLVYARNKGRPLPGKEAFFWWRYPFSGVFLYTHTLPLKLQLFYLEYNLYLAFK